MPQHATPMPTLSTPPWPDQFDFARTAFLLDVDGTILDIAATPQSVVVPRSLCQSLGELHAKTNGALALVSGRLIGDLDHLFAPLKLPAIGGHGAELRLTSDNAVQTNYYAPISPTLKLQLTMIADLDPGIIFEDKGSSVALHYRLAPRREHAIKSKVAAVLDHDLTSRLEMLCGKSVVEIKPSDYNKGAAVRALMKLSPFAQRSPLFIGDDTTDESVFNILPALGGRGASVGRPMRGADRIFKTPREVRNWLAHLCGRDGSDLP
jgi:trehalose 6-phosphate phosphatase